MKLCFDEELRRKGVRRSSVRGMPKVSNLGSEAMKSLGQGCAAVQPDELEPRSTGPQFISVAHKGEGKGVAKSRCG